MKIIKRFILPLTALTLLCLILWSMVFPVVLKMQMTDILWDYGFRQAAIEKTIMRPHTITFENIALDKDGFSTIKSIRAYFDWKGLFTKSTFDRIVVDEMELSAEIGEDYDLQISGWNGSLPPLLFQEAAAIDIEHIKLDMITAIGGIRMEAKGNSLIKKDGVTAINMALWGDQHQIQLDTRWQGQIKPDGQWSFTVDIQEGRLALDNITASRITGWTTIDNSNSELLPATGGQLTIGSLNIKALPFSKTQLTFESLGESFKIFTTAEAAGMKDMLVSLDIAKEKADQMPWVTGGFINQDVEPFLSFMTALHDSIKQDNTLPETYKTPVLKILGAHQTRKEIKNTLKASEFEQLEFIISGPADDLIGKISARNTKENNAGRYVIRLDPDVID